MIKWAVTGGPLRSFFDKSHAANTDFTKAWHTCNGAAGTLGLGAGIVIRVPDPSGTMAAVGAGMKAYSWKLKLAVCPSFGLMKVAKRIFKEINSFLNKFGINIPFGNYRASHYDDKIGNI